jgi:hypothetical protein
VTLSRRVLTANLAAQSSFLRTFVVALLIFRRSVEGLHQIITRQANMPSRVDRVRSFRGPYPACPYMAERSLAQWVLLRSGKLAVSWPRGAKGSGA